MLDLPIRKIQSDFTSIYAQILGCVIMGFVTRHKRYFTSDAPRLRKVLYLGLTSGLCGSITTFATWNVQCNQACFLDSTVMPGSYIPARVLAWLMCLSTCVALSLKSLHFGHFLATFSPNSDDNRPADAPAPPADACGPSSEPSLAAAYAVATAAAVLVPALQGQPQLAAAAGLGACGAFLRYLLSLLNPLWPSFPVGTLAANIAGTWTLAALYTVSECPLRAALPSSPAAAVVYGGAVGFCGCLSTVSTLVNELNGLPAAAAYRYGAVSFAAAQAGVALLFDLPILLLPAYAVKMKLSAAAAAAAAAAASTIAANSTTRGSP